MRTYICDITSVLVLLLAESAYICFLVLHVCQVPGRCVGNTESSQGGVP